MENLQGINSNKLGAYSTLLGSICMLVGAAIGIASGADLDSALYANDMEGYLKQAFANQFLLILNLSIWIVGVISLGVGATMMSMIGEQNSVKVQLIRYNYWIGVAIVVASYMAWLAVVVRLAPVASGEAAMIADVMGWFAVRLDWVATVLVLGTGPVLITAAGRGIWVPNWLRIWSLLSLIAGLLTTIAQYAGGLTTYGFLIIPVGMGWMIAAGVTLYRRESK